MAARTTMATLITRVRGRINDPAGAGQIFSDDEIQEELDRFRLVVRYVPLRPEVTVNPGGIIHYLDYYADLEDWEDGEILYDNRFGQIDLAPPNGNGTLVSADHLTGHWVFTENPSSQTKDGFTNAMPFGQIPLVRITGHSYDTWMAGSVLLRKWAAKVVLEFTFSTNQQTFFRSQQFTMLTKLADQYEEKARVLNAIAIRSDQSDQGAIPFGGYVGNGYYGQ